MKNIIYGLKDPRNDVFQYIGKSTVGNSRALKHLTDSHSGKVKEWIEELNEKWLYPIVEIIEEVDDIDNLSEREKYYVNFYYEINPNLLNVQLIDKNINEIRTEEDEEKFNTLIKVITDIPNILKIERLCRNMTQDFVSKEVGLSRSTISLCERSKNVTLETVIKYILFLKGYDIITKQKKIRARQF